jgi:hypothetical protein
MQSEQLDIDLAGPAIGDRRPDKVELQRFFREIELEEKIRTALPGIRARNQVEPVAGPGACELGKRAQVGEK